MKMPQSCTMRQSKHSEHPPPHTCTLLTSAKEKCQQEIQVRELFSFSHGIKHRFWTVRRNEEWEIVWFNTHSEPPPPSGRATPGLHTEVLAAGLARRGKSEEQVTVTQSFRQGLAGKPPSPAPVKGFVKLFRHIRELQDGLELLKWSRSGISWPD